MTATLLYREAALLRASDTGRTIHGLAMPFDQVADVDDGYGRYQEVFRRGAFTRTIAERGPKVKLFTQHGTHRLPIGRATELREDATGLRAAFAVAATRDGDEALELVRSQTVDGLSVGFVPVRERTVDGVVERLEVALREVSLVWSPAYEGALVAGVRASSPVLSADVARRRLEILLKAW